ncbi:hypothetical protein R3P38DRAFT_2807489 [Favolaschia claudopus]|uniref:Uncharacterized protein n=1 Tax=Favolaschia claudopus TaxID=2862362 RepID=A0AAV9ZIE5_9AGAR
MPPRQKKNTPAPEAPLEPEPTTEPPLRTRRGTAQLQPTAGPSRSSAQQTSSAARTASTGQEERGFAALSYRPSAQSLRTQQSTSSLGTIPEASIDAAPEVLPTRRRERGGPPEPPTPARILVQRLAANRSPVASPGIHYAGSDDVDDDNDDNNNDSQMIPHHLLSLPHRIPSNPFHLAPVVDSGVSSLTRLPLHHHLLHGNRITADNSDSHRWLKRRSHPLMKLLSLQLQLVRVVVVVVLTIRRVLMTMGTAGCGRVPLER